MNLSEIPSKYDNNKTSVEKIRDACALSSVNAHADPISVLIRKVEEPAVEETTNNTIANFSASDESKARTITPLPILKDNVRSLARVPCKMHAYREIYCAICV